MGGVLFLLFLALLIMEEQIRRTDEKIRQRFTVWAKCQAKPERRIVFTQGQIYEQRNVMLTFQYGKGFVSEQYSTLDAMLQSLPLRVFDLQLDSLTFD